MMRISGKRLLEREKNINRICLQLFFRKRNRARLAKLFCMALAERGWLCFTCTSPIGYGNIQRLFDLSFDRAGQSHKQHQQDNDGF